MERARIQGACGFRARLCLEKIWLKYFLSIGISVEFSTGHMDISLGFCGTSLDVEYFLKGECDLVSSGNIIHMSKF